jgi:ribosomal protein S18 acetylase RimI-like enzyme
MAKETEDLALDSEVCRAGVARVFEDPALGRYFVAEDEGRVVGSLMITYEWSDWRCGTVWWIQSVYVEPEYRGRGVYRLMYRTIQQIVEADETIRGIRLYVDKRNTTAQRVYERLGMNGEHYQLFEWMKG